MPNPHKYTHTLSQLKNFVQKQSTLIQAHAAHQGAICRAPTLILYTQTHTHTHGLFLVSWQLHASQHSRPERANKRRRGNRHALLLQVATLTQTAQGHLKPIIARHQHSLSSDCIKADRLWVLFDVPEQRYPYAAYVLRLFRYNKNGKGYVHESLLSDNNNRLTE